MSMTKGSVMEKLLLLLLLNDAKTEKMYAENVAI